ncbi:phosphate ABC transporter substrate-binding protein [Camelliibacillus cellulosilyticus]|uniref:Phosphate-binding protein n=1 Tax=Camelliibacillus cellulosilyticus TaxID=2174486 RepID=A0ABV9GLL1_9BACL
MKLFKLKGLVLLTAVLMLATACGTKDKQPNQAAQAKDLSGTLIVGGSTALQPLAAAAAQTFKTDHPKVDIQIQAGGSGTGLSEVANGHFNIGNSDFFAEEKDGIPAEQLVDHKVAVVGMTAAVNPKAGVDNLSKADLIKVFTGEVTNWKEVGGNDEKITLVNRPDGSGTLATFTTYALDGKKSAKGITEDASNTVKKIIAETPGAIGYLAFSYFNDHSVVKLAIDGVEATNENVETGKFPVWAYEHMYTKGKPDTLEKSFLDYMMSDAVQTKMLPEQGYIPVTKMQVERGADGKIMPKNS